MEDMPTNDGIQEQLMQYPEELRPWVRKLMEWNFYTDRADDDEFVLGVFSNPDQVTVYVTGGVDLSDEELFPKEVAGKSVAYWGMDLSADPLYPQGRNRKHA